MFPSQFTNISYQAFVTNLAILLQDKFHCVTTFVYMTQNIIKMHDLYRHIVVVITYVLLLSVNSAISAQQKSFVYLSSVLV